MKMPRYISGHELAKLLHILGYEITRQTGSHLQLTTLKGGEHYITIPKHDSLRIGTLSGIIMEVAMHFRTSKQEITERVFP